VIMQLGSPADGWIFESLWRPWQYRIWKNRLSSFCANQKSFASDLPTDFTDIIPDLKIVFAPGRSSYELKNAAVQAASAEFIAMIDADCVSRPDWLRRLLDSLRRHPRAAAVSGKTTYGGESLAVRISSLLSRAYSKSGRRGAHEGHLG